MSIQDILSSPLGKAGIGYLTGGPAGAAIGLLSGTPAGKGDSALEAIQSKAQAPDHSQIIDQGIEALNHPEIDDHLSMQDQVQVGAMLHGAKIFGGPHPAISAHLEPMEANTDAY